MMKLLPGVSLCGCLLLTTPVDANSDGNTNPEKPSAAVQDSHANPEHVVEVSFGNSQLFAGSIDEVVSGELGSYVPARSSLFILELLQSKWSWIFAMNIPWSGQPVLIDGNLIEKQIAPSMSLGLRWSPLRISLPTQTIVEGQVAALLGRSVGSSKGDIFFPLLGGRVHISRPNGFAMYIGTMFTLRRETLALIYGVGNKF